MTPSPHRLRDSDGGAQRPDGQLADGDTSCRREAWLGQGQSRLESRDERAERQIVKQYTTHIGLPTQKTTDQSIAMFIVIHRSSDRLVSGADVVDPESIYTETDAYECLLCDEGG